VARLVAGISPDHDVQAIEAALKAHDVDVASVKVFTKTPLEAHDESGLSFEYVIKDMEYNSLSDEETKNMGIMGDAGGTGVPGLTSSDRPGLTVSSFAEAEAAPDYLSGVAIDDDEVDNYNEAIEEGRAVAVYSAPGGDTTAAEAAFKAAGLKNVRSF
jgi:copper chaperone CopZ